MPHTVRDDDLYFVVDAESKTIMHMSESTEQLVIAQGDHNSERYTFEIPRYIEGHDMSLCNKAEIHYVNSAADRKTQRISGIYKITDLQVAEDDDSTVMCTWLISQNATTFVGTLSFSIRLACLTGTRIDYSWNTKAFNDVVVVESIDNTNEVATQYADVLEGWYNELVMAGTTGVNVVAEAEQKAIENMAEVEAETISRIKEIDVIAEVEQEVLNRISNAGVEAINNVQNAESIALESKREELITELLTRIPVYRGEVAEPIELIEFYLSNYNETYGPFECPNGMTWLQFINSSYYSAIEPECSVSVSESGTMMVLKINGSGNDLVGSSPATPPEQEIINGMTYYNEM